MTQDQTGPSWDVVLRPRLTPLVAYITAAVVAVVTILAAVFMRIKATGVVFRTSDQFGLAGVGLIVAAAILLIARPRLRLGPAGLAVRNFLADRIIPWSEVVAVSYPVGARWARVELPHDEYIAVLAIQAADRERAVTAMDTLRAAVAKYAATDRPER